MKRFFTEPYDFVKPYRSSFWVWLVQKMVPGTVRSSFRCDQWVFRGAENLTLAKAAKGGILLAPNHCRLADPALVGLMACEQSLFNYYMASWHLFMQEPGKAFTRWKLTRLGAFSIFREGTDRDALREASRILAEETRPLVVFPEGTWARQSDRILPLLDGLALIVRKAAKQTEKPVAVVPTAIRYWYLTDPRPELARRLGVLEQRIGWAAQDRLDLIPRIEKLTSGLLAIREVEYLGSPQTGKLEERMERIMDAVLSDAEVLLFGKRKPGLPADRVRNVMRAQVQQLQKTEGDATKEASIRESLKWTCFAQDISAHDLNYLRVWPTFERLAETVIRIEEALDGDELPSPLRVGAVVEMGRPLFVENAPKLSDRQIRQFGVPEVVTADAVMDLLGDRLRTLLDGLIAAGPPAAWQVPTDPVRSKYPAPPPELRLASCEAAH